MEKMGSGKSNRGCYLNPCQAVMLFLVAVASCATVGLVVYYGHPDYGNHGDSSEEVSVDRLGDSGTSSVATPAVTDMPITTTVNPDMDMEVRLPLDLVPTHYNLRLRPDIYADDPADFEFTGSVDIYLSVSSATNMVQLHTRQFNISHSSITVTMESGEAIEVDRAGIREVPAPLEFLLIPLTSSVQPGDAFIVHIEYTGAILNDAAGIYYSSYVNDAGDTVYLLASHLHNTGARKVFPCLDEPAFKATFDVTIERRASHSSKSNMRVVRTDTLSDGWLADVYERTPIMSTYLLAFLVSDFQCSERYTLNNMLVEVCARPDVFNQTEFVTSFAVEIQEWFEWYHNVSLPLGKMTHVAVPDFPYGGMENWGLVLYGEDVLLYDPMASPVMSKEWTGLYVSHSIAHTWFGDLVTLEWWDDIWLNEGMASHLERLPLDTVPPFNTLHNEEVAIVEETHTVLIDDSMVTSHPIYQTVSHPDEMWMIYDAITYFKGSAATRMMKYFLGQDTFRWGFSNFLKSISFGAASHTDLFQTLTEQAQTDGQSIDVAAIMDTWIRQMGYPLVHVTHNSDDNSLVLTQRHFLADPSANVTQESQYNYVWHVPITYMTDTDIITSLDDLHVHWLTDPQGGIEGVAAPEWVLVNAGQRFYYRVNYDHSNWIALINQLNNDHTRIPSASRAQIIDDLFNIGREGSVSQELALSAMQYLGDEDQYTVWYVVSHNLPYITHMMSKGTGKLLLEEYMQNLVRNSVADLGFDELFNDDHFAIRRRKLMLPLACSYQLPECLSHTSSSFQAWINGSPLSVNLADMTLCHGVAEGGVEAWEQAYARFLSSPPERDSILRALACSKQPWILQRYLEYALAEDEHGLTRQDMEGVLSAVATNPAGTHTAWAFFKANWHVFYERFGSDFALASMVNTLTASFSTDWELADLRAFTERNPDQGEAQQQFQTSLQRAQDNIQWRQNKEPALIQWLQDFLSQNP